MLILLGVVQLALGKIGKVSRDLSLFTAVDTAAFMEADERKYFHCSSWIGTEKAFLKKIKQDHSINRISSEADD